MEGHCLYYPTIYEHYSDAVRVILPQVHFFHKLETLLQYAKVNVKYRSETEHTRNTMTESASTVAD